jgi:hypothetical protein
MGRLDKVYPIILTVSSVIGAYVLGRWLGLLSVALAFIARLIIPGWPMPSLVFLAAAVGVGCMVLRRRRWV